MIRLCVLGPSGRMGRLVLDAAVEQDPDAAGDADTIDPDTTLDEESPGFTVVSAVDRDDSDMVGSEIAPGVMVTTDLAAGLAGADVYIDFTVPRASQLAAEAALERGVAAVIGTTGLDAEAERAIDALAERAPVLVAANFSLGVNLLLGLAERAARALGPAFDLEIVEIHHKHKRDAPSGTALALASALAGGRDGAVRNRLSREGEVGARAADELGVVAVRGGDVAGEHTAYFLGDGERIELTHRATSRRIFAQGALRAAEWLVEKSPGRYTMMDVLEL